MLRSTLRSPRALHAAALVAAITLALPAHAARRKTKPAPAPAETDSPRPAPAAVVQAVAPPAETVVVRPPASGSSIGLGIGLWSGSSVGKGVAFQVDYGIVRTPASWERLELEWRLAIMFAHPTEKNDLTQLALAYPPTYVWAGYDETTASVIEVVPTARVRLPLSPVLALFADAGLGIAQTMDTYVHDEMFMGRTVKKENVTGLVVRAGLGLAYDASPNLRLMVLPLLGSMELGPKYSAFEPTIAVAYRL